MFFCRYHYRNKKQPLTQVYITHLCCFLIFRRKKKRSKIAQKPVPEHPRVSQWLTRKKKRQFQLNFHAKCVNFFENSHFVFLKVDLCVFGLILNKNDVASFTITKQAPLSNNRSRSALFFFGSFFSVFFSVIPLYTCVSTFS